MSEFIEKSKHAQMAAAVTAHFGGDKPRVTPGDASGKSYVKGGAGDWNGQPMGLPQGSGVNYIPPSQAGHTVSAAPFSVADGMVHGKTMLNW